MASDKQHIVMLPFLAHGHLIPFLALAEQIQYRTGFTITTYTFALHNSTSTSTWPSFPSGVKIMASPQTRRTQRTYLAHHVIGILLTASEHLEAPTRCLVSDITEKKGKPPLCLISDVFFGWAVNEAKSSGTANVTFTTSGAYGTTASMSMWQHLPHCSVSSDDEDREFHIRWFPERCRLTCAGRVCESLRVELGGGKLEQRGADYRVWKVMQAWLI